METEAQTSMTRMTTHRILALTKRGLLFLLLAFSPFQLFTLLPLHLHAQGIPFFMAGEEFARSKDGDENSYASSRE